MRSILRQSIKADHCIVLDMRGIKQNKKIRVLRTPNLDTNIPKQEYICPFLSKTIEKLNNTVINPSYVSKLKIS